MLDGFRIAIILDKCNALYICIVIMNNNQNTIIPTAKKRIPLWQKILIGLLVFGALINITNAIGKQFQNSVNNIVNTSSSKSNSSQKEVDLFAQVSKSTIVTNSSGSSASNKNVSPVNSIAPVVNPAVVVVASAPEMSLSDKLVQALETVNIQGDAKVSMNDSTHVVLTIDMSKITLSDISYVYKSIDSCINYAKKAKAISNDLNYFCITKMQFSTSYGESVTLPGFTLTINNPDWQIYNFETMDGVSLNDLDANNDTEVFIHKTLKVDKSKIVVQKNS